MGQISAGAARLSLLSDETGRLYVNAKGLTPGRWNEHLWTGTCSSLGTRVAVLPGLNCSGLRRGRSHQRALCGAGPWPDAAPRLGVGRAVYLVRGRPTAGRAHRADETATVVRVVDGDTIVVDRGRGEEHIRYIGVDTPETVIPKPVEAFGREASAANRALVEGRQVVLERDISEVDRYGRLLRYVWLADGTSVELREPRAREAGLRAGRHYPPT